MHVIDSGAGPVVVFLHGSGPGASGHSNFKGNYPKWADQGYRCIVIDLVGFGFSDKPENVTYPLSFFVECVQQTLDALGVSSCAVVGNSLGGAVAVGLALGSPDLVSQLILLAPGGMSRREEYLQMPAMQKMFEVYAASDGALTEAGLREFFEFGLVYDACHITDALIAERCQILAEMNPQVMLTMDIPYLAERLSELVCPVLVFWGASDRMMPESGLLAMAHHCRAMKLILLSECGHWVMVEHEALFNSECLRFLADEGEHRQS
jgi:4,5:9,10-diseco-3-hydroxy-5,9,17-trioxoandrosta-1(10),2-diene-4-oate hydrolase